MGLQEFINAYPALAFLALIAVGFGIVVLIAPFCTRWLNWRVNRRLQRAREIKRKPNP